ncbi:MAG: lipoprotein [Methylomonas sp.]|jgi:predicted small lipoprotein YifL
MMKHYQIIFAAALLLLQACGQTGPLYLPGKDKPPVYVPPAQ